MVLVLALNDWVTHAVVLNGLGLASKFDVAAADK